MQTHTHEVTPARQDLRTHTSYRAAMASAAIARAAAVGPTAAAPQAHANSSLLPAPHTSVRAGEVLLSLSYSYV